MSDICHDRRIHDILCVGVTPSAMKQERRIYRPTVRGTAIYSNLITLD